MLSTYSITVWYHLLRSKQMVKMMKLQTLFAFVKSFWDTLEWREKFLKISSSINTHLILLLSKRKFTSMWRFVRVYISNMLSKVLNKTQDIINTRLVNFINLHVKLYFFRLISYFFFLICGIHSSWPLFNLKVGYVMC